VKDAGFLYDSSLMASDDAYEVTIDGQPSGVVELPIERILDDAPYYGAACGSLPSPELVDRIYRAEFDVAYQEGGLYVLTMHPHYTGHRSRALWLESLITYMKSKPGVWFATHEQVAVGMRVAPHPPHRPVLALLTHTVPTSDVGMFGVKAYVRIGVQNLDWWKQAPEPCPKAFPG